MDMWVTIDTDTKAALRWRKSFTVDEPDYVPLPMSFLLDEEKEVALFCACSEALFSVISLCENGVILRATNFPSETLVLRRLLLFSPAMTVDASSEMTERDGRHLRFLWIIFLFGESGAWRYTLGEIVVLRACGSIAVEDESSPSVGEER
ncbi:hypothetical protein F2Q68_00025004 [Brassica cretica]|uniref:F-box associated domain-containing protein n=1 Tax=Brassica cretica TaxID=69181 RepID=A0A8S9IF66_BRACR|nr:hypothetical protein F2Q68_00025004 [Brassica cretica]